MYLNQGRWCHCIVIVLYWGGGLVCFLSHDHSEERDVEWIVKQMGSSLLEDYVFIKGDGCCFSGGPVAVAVINRPCFLCKVYSCSSQFH